MMSGMRSTWLAASGALILVLALGGAAFAADTQGETSLADPSDATTTTVVAATTAFVDVDGDGIDDTCDQSVVADPAAEAAALAAVDTDGDGVVSVTEAAHSDRVGGTNCNHGGYVSGVAQAQCDGSAATDDTETPTAATGTITLTVADDEQADETEDTAEDANATEEQSTADDCTESAPAATTTDCVPVAAPPFDPATMTGPGAFGRYVSSVAQSDAIGGKNCNHGGAVSEAVHAAKAAAKTARDAAKAERKAARDAAKAQRSATHGNGNKGKSGH